MGTVEAQTQRSVNYLKRYSGKSHSVQMASLKNSRQRTETGLYLWSCPIVTSNVGSQWVSSGIDTFHSSCTEWPTCWTLDCCSLLAWHLIVHNFIYSIFEQLCFFKKANIWQLKFSVSLLNDVRIPTEFSAMRLFQFQVFHSEYLLLTYFFKAKLAR